MMKLMSSDSAKSALRSRLNKRERMGLLECLNCRRKQPEMVRYCSECIKEEVKELNKKRVKDGKKPYER